MHAFNNFISNTQSHPIYPLKNFLEKLTFVNLYKHRLNSWYWQLLQCKSFTWFFQHFSKTAQVYHKPQTNRRRNDWCIAYILNVINIDNQLSLTSSFGLILYYINNIFSASLVYPQSCIHSALRLSIRPQLAFMVSLISLMIYLGEILLDPKASIIFPLELLELGNISLVFHVILLFFKE